VSPDDYPGGDRLRPIVRLLGLRLLYFLLVFGALTVAPLDLDLLLRVMIAVVVSMLLSVFLLRRDRQEVGQHLVDRIDARRAQRATDNRS
jgi:dipeptide/tripeptide permease